MDTKNPKPTTTDVRFFPSLEEALEYAQGIRQHIPSSDCWCFPSLEEVDDDGVHYYKHHYEQ